MAVGSLALEFDPRNRMRPLFFESDGNFRLQSDPRRLTSNLTLKDDLDKSGFLAAASHLGRLSFGAKRSQIGW